MTDTPPEKTPLLGVDWLKAVAGSLAAVSTTVLLSTLGAAGTLVGAAVGSLAATVATALYSHGLDRSRRRVLELSEQRLQAGPAKRAPVRPEVRDAEPRGGWGERLRELPWRRLLPAALAMFVVVIAAVTIFEVLAGRTLASTVRGDDGGGTTISRVTRGGGDGGSRNPTPSPTTGSTPGDGSTGTTEPTPAPTEEPTSTPTTEPTGEPSPSEDTSPTPAETPEPTLGGSPSVDPEGRAEGQAEAPAGE